MHPLIQKMLDELPCRCWRCGVPVATKASVLCDECHIKEVAAIHAGEKEPVGGLSCVNDGAPPPGSLTLRDAVLMRRGMARNGRVIRKSEPMGG